MKHETKLKVSKERETEFLERVWRRECESWEKQNYHKDREKREKAGVKDSSMGVEGAAALPSAIPGASSISSALLQVAPTRDPTDFAQGRTRSRTASR